MTLPTSVKRKARNEKERFNDVLVRRTAHMRDNRRSYCNRSVLHVLLRKSGAAMIQVYVNDLYLAEFATVEETVKFCECLDGTLEIVIEREHEIYNLASLRKELATGLNYFEGIFERSWFALWGYETHFEGQGCGIRYERALRKALNFEPAFNESTVDWDKVKRFINSSERPWSPPKSHATAKAPKNSQTNKISAAIKKLSVEELLRLMTEKLNETK